MFMRAYASSRVNRKSFYRKSELQMFLLISGRHIWWTKTLLQYGVSIQSSTKVLETFRQISQKNVGHKDLRLGQIVHVLVFYNISFSWLLPLDGFQFIFFVAWHWNDLKSFAFTMHTVRHRVFWAHVRLNRKENFQKSFPQQNTSQYPWWWEEIRDSPGRPGGIGARFFDAEEICELRLHTVTYNEPQNRIKWPWIEPRLNRKSNNKPKFNVSEIYFYIYSENQQYWDGPNLFICMLVMFLNRVFRQERFNRFL